jgi:hypothetical protein
MANLLDDLVSQQPVPNFCATVRRRVQKHDVPTGSTSVASPIETGTATSPLQRGAKGGASWPCDPVRRAGQ